MQTPGVRKPHVLRDGLDLTDRWTQRIGERRDSPVRKKSAAESKHSGQPDAMKEAGAVRTRIGKLLASIQKMVRDPHQSSLLSDDQSVLDDIQRFKEEVGLVGEDINAVLKTATNARVGGDTMKNIKLILDEQKLLLETDFSRFVHKKALVIC